MKEGVIPSHIFNGTSVVPNPEYAKALYRIVFLDRYGNVLNEQCPELRTNDPNLLLTLQKQYLVKQESTTQPHE